MLENYCQICKNIAKEMILYRSLESEHVENGVGLVSLVFAHLCHHLFFFTSLFFPCFLFDIHNTE